MGAQDPSGSDDGEDVVVVGGPVARGDGYQVLRKRRERLELGELRAAKEGTPIHGELVRLHARADAERVFDVEVLACSKPAPEATRTGPAQFATDDYRKNWDAIFGDRKKRPSDAN